MREKVKTQNTDIGRLLYRCSCCWLVALKPVTRAVHSHRITVHVKRRVEFTLHTAPSSSRSYSSFSSFSCFLERERERERDSEREGNMFLGLKLGSPTPTGVPAMKCRNSGMDFRVLAGGGDGGDIGGGVGGFPAFLPKEVQKIKDPFARTLAQRIVRLPVRLGFSEHCIMSSCVKPLVQSQANPVVLLHCFDSSCLEWRCAYPLLEEAGLEAWAVDVLGWGFSNLERLPPCCAASKRHHLYQLWKSHIKRPMILVGPSLGAAVAIDFAVNHSEAVEKLVLIDASVYAEGTGNLTKLPRAAAYAGVSLLQSIPLRLYANLLAFNNIPFPTSLDWTNVGRLHCLLPWWKDATVNFMISGGYNVIDQIKQVKQKVLIIWGEHDRIINKKFAVRLHCELPNAISREIPDCGHLPHIEKPNSVVKLIADFALRDHC